MLSIGLHAQRNSAPNGVRVGTGHNGAQLGTNPVNDQCNLITPQDLAVGSTLTVTGTTTGATINGDYTDGSIMFGFGVPSVWHSFTTTECANVRIDYCGSASVFSDYWNVLVLDCPATDNLVITPIYNTTDCVDGNPTIYFNDLPPGTYEFPVWCDVNTANGPYTLHIAATSCATTAPGNDECTGANILDLTPGHDLMVTGDNTGATDSEGLGYANVWEAFTISECATVTVSYCGTSGFSAFAEGLMTACPDGSMLAPSSTLTCVDGQLTERFMELAPGTYYIPVSADAGSQGAYSIMLAAEACQVQGPPNDHCADAVPVMVVSNEMVSFDGDNTGATSAGDAVGGSVFDGLPLVWHAFTLTECMDVVIDYCGTPSVFATVMTTLATSCPANEGIEASGFLESCHDNLVMRFQHLTAGTYYLPVLDIAHAEGEYHIHLLATPCAHPPQNDECDGAQPLDVHVECTPVFSTLLGATGSMPPVDCNGNGTDGNDDVWFSFVALQPGQIVNVSGADVDAVIEVFKGDCDNLISIGCSDTSGVGGTEALVVADLVPGSTYHVRVYNWQALAPSDPRFDICVYGDIGTGIGTASVSSFSVFPNPGNGNVTLTRNGASGNVTIELFDMTGRRVLSQGTYLSGGEQRTFQWAGRLAPGTYSLRVSGADGTSQQRFMVK